MALTTQVGMEFIARNKANRTMLAFGNSVGQIRYRLRGLLTSVLAVAGVGGFGYMIRQQMKTIDSTAKLSDRLGIATESLIGLQHAASITGTNAETLNKSLEIFVRRLGEMTQGSGEAKRGLDMLGLTAEMLIHQSPAESFGIAADRIKQLGTQAEKTAAAYFLFGRAGSQMLNMLEAGSGGLKEYQKEAEKLGLTFSRFDAAQIEAANDALTRARATITGLSRQVTIQLAPYIEILADKFVNFATAGEGAGANIVNVFESMNLAGIRFGSTIQTLPAYWKGFEAAAHESLAVVYELADVATNLDVLFKKLGKWKYTYKELAQQQRQIAAGLLETGGRQLAGTYGQENAVRRFYDNLRIEAAQRRAQLESGAAGPAIGLDAVSGVGAEEMQGVLKRTREALTSIRHMDYLTRMERIQNLKAYADENAATLQKVDEANKLVNEEIRRVERSRLNAMQVYSAELREDMQNTSLYASEKLATAARSIESSMSDSFYHVMAEGRNMRDTLVGFIESVRQAFIRLAAEMIARQIMANMLGGVVGGLLGGVGGFVGGLFGGSGAAGATKNVFTSPHGGPALQHGGEVLETGWAKVHRGETYSGVGGGGGNMTIIIENKGQPMNVLNAEMRDAEDERVLHLVVDDAQGNGPVRRMVQEIVANME